MSIFQISYYDSVSDNISCCCFRFQAVIICLLQISYQLPFVDSDIISDIILCFCFRYHIMSLEGKTAVITGFGGGLGSVIAVSLAQAGCAIVGTSRRCTETVQANIVKIQEM